MDRNTTTGLILIGAVMVAFFMLNQPPDQPMQEDKAEKQIQKESDIEQKESLEIAVNDTNSNSLSVEDSIIGAKLAEQKEQQRLINAFGVFYKAGIGVEKDFTLKNDKISIAISSKGGSINEAKMIEKSDDGKYKYKTHHDFVNEIEEPLSLFEKGSSTMSLVVEDIENSSLIYTKDLFFELVSSTDSSLILRANAGTADKYLQYTYLLPKGKYDVEFQIDYHNLDNVIDPQVDFEWGMKGLSTEKLADDERMICSIMYRYFGEGRDYMTERSDKEEDIQGTMNWIAFKHKFFSSVLISDDEGFTSGKMVQKQLESDDYTISYYTNVELPSQERIPLKFFFGPND